MKSKSRNERRCSPARAIRRACVALAGLGAVGSAFTASAQSAADYPSKPVRVIIGQAPGGGNDIQTRLFSQKLGESLGQSFVVENRTGAGSVISYRTVAKATPDGYTLLAVSGGFSIAPAVRQNLGYDTIKDFAPISLVAQAPFLLMAHPSLPVSSVKDVIALAKQRAGMLTHASAGQGSSTHLAFALFTTLAGIDVIHVPYKGTGPALIDVISGQVHMLMGNVLSSLSHAKSGKLRALAVSTAKRSPALPELPTLAEAGVPGYESSTWHAWLAPAGTPQPIVEKLSAELAKASKSPEAVARLSPDGALGVGSSPEQLRQFLIADIARWRKVVRDANIKLQ